MTNKSRRKGEGGGELIHSAYHAGEIGRVGAPGARVVQIPCTITSLGEPGSNEQLQKRKQSVRPGLQTHSVKPSLETELESQGRQRAMPPNGAISRTLHGRYFLASAFE